MTENEIIKQLHALNIDTESALERFLDNKEMYVRFIREFATDKLFIQIEDALKNKNWKDAFELAHSLKGTTGNLGIMFLYEAFSKISVAYRNNNYKEMENIYYQTKTQYTGLCNEIKKLTLLEANV